MFFRRGEVMTETSYLTEMNVDLEFFPPIPEKYAIDQQNIDTDTPGKNTRAHLL